MTTFLTETRRSPARLLTPCALRPHRSNHTNEKMSVQFLVYVVPSKRDLNFTKDVLSAHQKHCNATISRMYGVLFTLCVPLLGPECVAPFQWDSAADARTYKRLNSITICVIACSKSTNFITTCSSLLAPREFCAHVFAVFTQ